MTTIDYTRIKSATPKYPEIMDKKAEEKFIKEFNVKTEIEASLYKARDVVYDLEKQLKEQSLKVDALSKMFDIEYEERSFKEINNKASFGVFTPTDIARKSRVD